MKSILLTTTAIVAFAGAAAADGHTGVSFTGSATVGFNDDTAGDHDGFYTDMNLDVSMSAELDNGVTVTATADVDELDAEDDDWDGVTLELASENASLTIGDTDPSADKHWSGVDGDTVADFNDRDAHLDGGPYDAIIRGEATMSGVTASLSYGIGIQNGSTDQLDALQVAAVADLGGFSVIGAYQGDLDVTGGDDTQFGISASGTVAGMEVMGSYLSDTEDGFGNEVSSIGINVAYPVGPVTVGGYYSFNTSDTAANDLDAYGIDVAYADGPISVSADYDMIEDADEGTWEIDANYDTGAGLIVHAGLVDSGEDYYVAGTYDLGGGASLLVSYVEDGDDDGAADDEIGEDDLQIGTTVEVSFSF